MGDGNENEKSSLLVTTESTAAYSEDVIGKYIFYGFIYRQIDSGI